MKLYISGQITGLDYQDAFARFEAAEALLRSFGHFPVNPMKSVGEVPGKRWIEYMAEDIQILDNCDGIYMLSNWRQSKGAKLEHYLCELTDKAIYYAYSLPFMCGDDSAVEACDPEDRPNEVTP